jgi:hypothetical protein
MTKDHNVEERGVDAAARHSLNDEAGMEKGDAMHSEDFHGAAERGHVATDKYDIDEHSMHGTEY